MRDLGSASAMGELASRRAFLTTLVGLGAAAPGMGRAAESASIRPGPRVAKIKLSCNLYSFNEPLRSGQMTLDEVFESLRGARLRRGRPDRLLPPRLSGGAAGHLPLRDEEEGVSSRTGHQRDGSAERFHPAGRQEPRRRRGTRQALGRGRGEARRTGVAGVSRAAGRRRAAAKPRCSAGYETAAGRARPSASGAGVIITIQNHDDFLKTAAQVLALRERVGSDWFGLNVDIGSLRHRRPV